MMRQRVKVFPAVEGRPARQGLAAAALLGGVLAAGAAGAQDVAESALDTGDTAWMLVSTVLVLAMIIPGLGLFYGGLVRSKNMLATLMQVTTAALIGMILWAVLGYSLAFTEGPMNSFIGGLDRAFLAGVTPDSEAGTIPEMVFIAFQMTFAALTTALVLGGTAERIKFGGVVVFALLWPLLSYYPIAHMVWSEGGYLFEMGALDFAGGTVVHINCGVGALVGALILGARTGWRKDPMPPHSLPLTYIGAGLLWVGWFGFNAGSALGANGGAGLALLNTLLATAAAGLSWVVTEAVLKGKPSALGLASGVIAGLVAVTPAAGFVGPMGAIVLGLVAAPISVVFCSTVKHALKYDDSLDVFGIHGVCGVIGAIGTGIFAASSLGGAVEGLDIAGQTGIQVIGVVVAIVWSAVASLIVWYVVKALGLLRVSTDKEREGLDTTVHGEAAYHS